MNKGFKLLIDDSDIKIQALKHVRGPEMEVFVEDDIDMGVSKHADEGDRGKGIALSEPKDGDRLEINADGDSILDSDYNMVSDSIDDDDLFDKYVDGDDSGDEDVVDSDNDFDDARLSDVEGDGSAYPVYNPVESNDPTFELGMIFSSKTKFIKVVQSHAIKTKGNLKFTKNDKVRVYAVCTGEDCKWKITVLKVKNEATFQINYYSSEHTCPQIFHVKNVKTRWLSEKYIQKFKSDPNRNVKGFRVDVMNELRLHVSKDQAYRAKKLALKKLEGSPEYQYSRLLDYAEEVRTTNPGSTVSWGMRMKMEK
ncbi:UNVERIFIED_CONTAM: hypothetical protein Sangu_1565600 [Sesamum angustifolium]|uniref:Transposase MuDR plant domain-containing protein n=1 Tax=Sesamum angustifolium TaxID=2727405 RepID=A0AAW2MRH9_9LAMI